MEVEDLKEIAKQIKEYSDKRNKLESELDDINDDGERIDRYYDEWKKEKNNNKYYLNLGTERKNINLIINHERVEDVFEFFIDFVKKTKNNISSEIREVDEKLKTLADRVYLK